MLGMLRERSPCRSRSHRGRRRSAVARPARCALSLLAASAGVPQPRSNMRAAARRRRVRCHHAAAGAHRPRHATARPPRRGRVARVGRRCSRRRAADHPARAALRRGIRACLHVRIVDGTARRNAVVHRPRACFAASRIGSVTCPPRGSTSSRYYSTKHEPAQRNDSVERTRPNDVAGRDQRDDGTRARDPRSSAFTSRERREPCGHGRR